MADVTISDLSNLAPASNTYIPLSNGTTTGKAQLSSIPGITPIGGIIMWSGSIASIPTNWALCNGLNGTPDLRDRFIVGAGTTYSPGNIGGAAAVTPAGTISDTTLTIAQIPSHNHKIWGQDNTAAPSGNPSNEVANIENPGTGSAYFQRNSDTAGGGGAHTHTFTGTSQANLPPYYALAYIMRTS